MRRWLLSDQVIVDETDGDNLLMENEDILTFEPTQYTATNGSSIVLTEAVEKGDVIFIIP